MSGVPRLRMRGRKNWAAKLNEEKVREIRAWKAKGRSYRQIAEHVGCTPAAVRGVILRGHWGWVK